MTTATIVTARRPGLDRRVRSSLWPVLAMALATVTVVGLPLNGNVRYEVGVHRVSGYSVAETFSHRPITFRLIAAAQAWVPDALSALGGPPGSFSHAWLFETGFRLGAAVWCAAAALVLWKGLRRRFGTGSPAYAVAAFAGLMFIAPATGEPDWLAAVLAVAAVGAGLCGRRGVGGTVAGVLLAVAALVKISSLPIAVAALILLWALDHRRGVVAGVAALGTGLLAVAAMAAWAPYEIAWLLDIRALQPDPWTRLQAIEAGNYFLNLAARWPTVALLPAFFVGVRWREAWPAAAALALGAFGIVLQGQYFIYHSAGLVALSAVLAVRTLGRTGTAVHLPLLACSAWTLALFLSPAGWRIQHGAWLYLVTAAWVVGFVLWQRRSLHRPHRTPGTDLRAAIIALALLATQTLASAEALTMNTAGQTALVNVRGMSDDLAAGAEIHAVIGVDTPVVYLAFGSTAYALGNPTHCRYPSPLFLQRPEAKQVVSLATRQENLACVTEPGARWLVWDRGWLHRKGAPADLLAAIDATWDCEEALLAGRYTVCPRRP